MEADAGYSNFIDVCDGTKALEIIQTTRPDVVLLDVCMPPANGLDILSELRAGTVAADTPVVIFTSANEKDTKVTALNLGASDFLEKPVDRSELLARIRNTLLAKLHTDHLNEYSSKLEHEVRLRTTALTISRRDAIHCLARAGELRDDQTGLHVIRVGRYAAIIAEELGFGEERVLWLEHAAQLHDVGKIGIPDSILHKPGKLNDEEWKLMKGHCTAGVRVLLNANIEERQTCGVFEANSIIKLAALVANSHHEKWDGSGYPNGLAGTNIPIEGRITAVADVFDALSTKRAYKDALPLEKCFQILENSRATHFDPDCLDAFFRRKSDVIRTFHEYSDMDNSRLDQ